MWFGKLPTSTGSDARINPLKIMCGTRSCPQISPSLLLIINRGCKRSLAHNKENHDQESIWYYHSQTLAPRHHIYTREPVSGLFGSKPDKPIDRNRQSIDQKFNRSIFHNNVFCLQYIRLTISYLRNGRPVVMELQNPKKSLSNQSIELNNCSTGSVVNWNQLSIILHLGENS